MILSIEEESLVGRVANGTTYEELAEEMDVCVLTVKRLMDRIHEKLGFEGRNRRVYLMQWWLAQHPNGNGTVARDMKAPEGVRRPCDTLSDREIQITSMIAQGKKNREIAAKLGVSEAGIKQACRRMYDKVGCSSRAELLAMLPGWAREAARL